LPNTTHNNCLEITLFHRMTVYNLKKLLTYLLTDHIAYQLHNMSYYRNTSRQLSDT